MKPALRSLCDHLRRLFRDRRGNVLMIFGLSLLPLTFATGMGIDYARAMRLQTKLDAAADAAALAAVGKYASDNVTNITVNVPYLAARQMFMMQTQSLIGAGGLTIDYNNATQLTITPSTAANGARVYTVSYNAESTNAFASILGLATLHIRGSSTANTVPPTYIDIHVALDTSQSMGLAATDADAKALYAATSLPKYNTHACTFGCHVTSTDDPWASKANDVIAKEAGVTLRIDVLRDATTDMIQSAIDDQGAAQLYRFGLYRIGKTSKTDTYSTIAPLSTNLSSVKAAAQGVTLGYNENTGMGDTDLSNATNYAYQQVMAKAHGDGATQNTARAFLFIITDGVNDLPGSCGTTGHCTRPLDPTACQTWKNNNITVGIVYTTYLPVYNNPNNQSAGTDDRYNLLVKSFSQPGYSSPNPTDNSADIKPALQACASSGWFFEASDESTIHAAMQKLFQQATQTARLTK